MSLLVWERQMPSSDVSHQALGRGWLRRDGLRRISEMQALVGGDTKAAGDGKNQNTCRKLASSVQLADGTGRAWLPCQLDVSPALLKTQ